MSVYDPTQSPAAAKTDDPNYPFHLSLPWGNVGRVEVKLSTEAARALAHAILDADRHPMEAPALARVEIIDVSAHAVERWGSWEAANEALPEFARPLPKHDYRFHCEHDRENGSTWTAGAQYTAADVMHSIEQDRTFRKAGA